MLVESLLETAKFLKLILPPLFFGLFISEAIYTSPRFTGFVNAISSLICTRLKSGVAIAAFLIHPVTAFSILSEMSRRGVIDDREVIIASMAGILPRTIRLTILYVAPVVIPALGYWGLIYIAIMLFTRGIIAFAAVIAGGNSEDAAVEVYTPRPSFRELSRRFVHIAVTLSVTIFLSMLIFNAGLLEFLESARICALSPSAMLIVAMGVPSMLAGIAAAGSAYASGAISGLDAIIALYIASILHMIVEMPRNTIPVTASLFGKSLGLKVSLTVAFGRFIANAMAIALLYLARFCVTVFNG